MKQIKHDIESHLAHKGRIILTHMGCALGHCWLSTKQMMLDDSTKNANVMVNVSIRIL